MVPTCIRVRNLDLYQHYKQRNPPWIKLHNSMLEDYDFGRLPDASKWLAVGLLLLASRLNNEIPDDPTWIKNKLSMSSKPDLNLLETMGFIERLQDASAMLASCVQNADSETEGERETETEGHRHDDRAVLSNWNGPGFDAFWDEYPRKVAKGEARKAWKALLPKGASREDSRELFKAVVGLLRERVDGEWDGREKKAIPYPATFLRGEEFGGEH